MNDSTVSASDLERVLGAYWKDPRVIVPKIIATGLIAPALAWVTIPEYCGRTRPTGGAFDRAVCEGLKRW